jgi:hypothetical protein
MVKEKNEDMLGFVIKIHFELNDGKKIKFEGSGCQESQANFFQGWPYMSVSPKQLASAKSVDELVKLLADNVIDEDFQIFSAPRPMNSHVVKGSFDAYDFVKMIRETIIDVKNISKVTVVLKEYNELHFYREYAYNYATGEYIGIELGTPEAAEDCYGDWIDQSILGFSDIDKCKIVKRKDLYRESNSDDIYFDWVGCVVE